MTLFYCLICKNSDFVDDFKLLRLDKFSPEFWIVAQGAQGNNNFNVFLGNCDLIEFYQFLINYRSLLVCHV